MPESRIIWTSTAIEDLAHIREYVSTDDPLAARRLIRRITDCTARLEEFSMSGRWVPELNDPVYREVIVPPYRVVYRASGDRLFPLRVIHSARDFLTEFSDD